MDALGMCEECILVLLDDEFLEHEKKRQRAEIEARATKKAPFICE